MPPEYGSVQCEAPKASGKPYLVYLCIEMRNCGVLERGQAFDEEIVADATATDRAGGRTGGHFDGGELLNGGSMACMSFL